IKFHFVHLLWNVECGMWNENSTMIEALVYNALYLCGYLTPHSTLLIPQINPHSTLHTPH
ncbi:MAG: hypothetical protein IK148_06870, partial [Prevotella sp.]|nr:hypothetical protein [Prevotella sp.]